MIGKTVNVKPGDHLYASASVASSGATTKVFGIGYMLTDKAGTVTAWAVVDARQPGNTSSWSVIAWRKPPSGGHGLRHALAADQWLQR